jgi:hypothetical protein
VCCKMIWLLPWHASAPVVTIAFMRSLMWMRGSLLLLLCLPQCLDELC